jgi:hypothetical protein
MKGKVYLSLSLQKRCSTCIGFPEEMQKQRCKKEGE